MDRTASDAIIRNAAAGDQDAMEELLRLTSPSVGFACGFLLNHSPETDSAVLSILEKIRRNLTSLRTPDAFPGWVSRITVRHCMGILKKSQPQLFVTGSHERNLPPTEPAPESFRIPPAAEDTEEKAAEALQYLQRLPAQHRVCAFLFYFSAHSLREIGNLMDTTEAAAAFRLEAARKALREHIETEYLGWYLSRCADAGISAGASEPTEAPAEDAEVLLAADAEPEEISEEELLREFPEIPFAPPSAPEPAEKAGAGWLYLVLLILLAVAVGFFASVIRSGALADRDFWAFAKASSAAVLPYLT